MNLLWTLVVALVFFGLQSHVLWIGAGALVVVLLAVETATSRRSRGRRSGQRP